MTTEELVSALRDVATNSNAPEVLASAMGADPAKIALLRTMAPIAAALYNLAANVAESGHDPVTVIERIADAKPWLDATEAGWAAKIAGKPA